ncbi:MAG TPA: VWA domain-containing protein [Vicinamibacterales bacterium]|nr:VWA domain-containing protein [Vicinamibacterales bacterium]
MIGAPPIARGVGQPAPRFRSSVQMVTVAAVVRDHKGRFVRDLKRHDVQVLDKGAPRTIQEFRSDLESPVSIALLFDESGSMSVGSTAMAARAAAAHLLAALDSRRDEVAVFAFDSKLRAVEPFTSDLDGVRTRLLQPQPFGTTSLFDAIAGAAEQIAQRSGARRKAIVVLTDGVDTSSRLRPAQVSAKASAIDVPVYVLSVVLPLDHAGAETAVETRALEALATDLANMAQWTGGDVFTASAPAHSSTASRRIVSELRHQYLIAFEASAEPGWHPIEVRVRDRGAIVRARSGYVVGSS